MDANSRELSDSGGGDAIGVRRFFDDGRLFVRFEREIEDILERNLQSGKCRADQRLVFAEGLVNHVTPTLQQQDFDKRWPRRHNPVFLHARARVEFELEMTVADIGIVAKNLDYERRSIWLWSQTSKSG